MVCSGGIGAALRRGLLDGRARSQQHQLLGGAGREPEEQQDDKCSFGLFFFLFEPLFFFFENFFENFLFFELASPPGARALFLLPAAHEGGRGQGAA